MERAWENEIENCNSFKNDERKVEYSAIVEDSTIDERKTIRHIDRELEIVNFKFKVMHLG